MTRGNRAKYNFYDEPIPSDIDDEVNKTIENKSSAEVKTTGPETINGIIDGAINVKMRKIPKITPKPSDAIEVLPKGSRVIILERLEGFYKVKTIDNREGYIASQYLKEV